MSDYWLIEKVKTETELTTDYQVAKAIGIERQKISGIKAGRQKLNENEIYQLAEILKISPLDCLASIIADRQRDPKWKKLWSNLSKHSVILALASTLLASTYPIDSKANLKSFSEVKDLPSYTLCAVRYIPGS